MQTKEQILIVIETIIRYKSNEQILSRELEILKDNGNEYAYGSTDSETFLSSLCELAGRTQEEYEAEIQQNGTLF